MIFILKIFNSNKIIRKIKDSSDIFFHEELFSLGGENIVNTAMISVSIGSSIWKQTYSPSLNHLKTDSMHWKKNYGKILYVPGKSISAVPLSLVSVSLGTSLATIVRKLVTLTTVKCAYLAQNNKNEWGGSDSLWLLRKWFWKE